MEQQIKNLLERFERRIITYVKRECPEFMGAHDEKILYEPTRSICFRNNIIKLIFNEIYSCMGDYCGPQMHGFLLDKIMVYTDHIETKTTASYELSIGKAVGLMIRKTAHKELRPKVGEWLKSYHNKEYLT